MLRLIALRLFLFLALNPTQRLAHILGWLRQGSHLSLLLQWEPVEAEQLMEEEGPLED